MRKAATQRTEDQTEQHINAATQRTEDQNEQRINAATERKKDQNEQQKLRWTCLADAACLGQRGPRGCLALCQRSRGPGPSRHRLCPLLPLQWILPSRLMPLSVNRTAYRGAGQHVQDPVLLPCQWTFVLLSDRWIPQDGVLPTRKKRGKRKTLWCTLVATRTAAIRYQARPPPPPLP